MNRKIQNIGKSALLDVLELLNDTISIKIKFEI